MVNENPPQCNWLHRMTKIVHDKPEDFPEYLHENQQLYRTIKMLTRQISEILLVLVPEPRVDDFSKCVELVPLRKATSAQLKRAFRERILNHCGIPQAFVCDNGTHFTSRFFKAFCKQSGMEIQYTPPQNPTERVTRTNKTKVSQYIEGQQTMWDENFCLSLIYP